MYIEDIGRPSKPISWILKEINDEVLLDRRFFNEEQDYNEIQDGPNYYSPEMQELDYENVLSELALEYVDQIVAQPSIYAATKKKRVSMHVFDV